jgi:hypothetical protein
MHPVLYSRLSAIRQALSAAHQDGGPSAISGYVREQTVKQLILPSLPVKYRVTTGQIIDQSGNASGQLDIIVENSHFPSLAAPSIADVRLILAEGVSSVVEIKSTLPAQWDQVLVTKEKLKPLRRIYRDGGLTRGDVSDHIPFFVVAYQGWSQVATIQSKIDDAGIDGVLVLQPQPTFVGRIYKDDVQSGTEEAAIWVFICALHFHATQILDANCDLFAYSRNGLTRR